MTDTKTFKSSHLLPSPEVNMKAVPHEPTAEMLAAAMLADRDGMPATMKTIWMVMWGAYTAPQTNVAAIDETWIARFAAWNFATFGPGMRTAGTVDHIRKECREIEANPHDPKEWVDIILLGINGLVRQGRTPAQIVAEICGKHEINEHRKWPDWRATDPSKAIEHDRAEADHGQA